MRLCEYVRGHDRVGFDSAEAGVIGLNELHAPRAPQTTGSLHWDRAYIKGIVRECQRHAGHLKISWQIWRSTLTVTGRLETRLGSSCGGCVMCFGDR